MLLSGARPLHQHTHRNTHWSGSTQFHNLSTKRPLRGLSRSYSVLGYPSYHWAGLVARLPEPAASCPTGCTTCRSPKCAGTIQEAKVIMQIPDISVISTWPPPNYINPETRGPAAIIVVSILLFLVTVLLAVRVYTRVVISRGFGLDDILILLAFVRNSTRCPPAMSLHACGPSTNSASTGPNSSLRQPQLRRTREIRMGHTRLGRPHRRVYASLTGQSGITAAI